MRTTKTMTISLPPPMLYMFESVRKAENRTRSEMVREALRKYFDDRFPVVEPTKEELAIFRKGREDIKNGRYVTLDQLRNELESLHYRPRKQRYKKTSKKGI